MKENPTKPCVCGNYWRTFWTDADGRRRSHSLGPVATLTEPQAKRKWRAWAKTDYLLASRGVTPQTVAAAVSPQQHFAQEKEVATLQDSVAQQRSLGFRTKLTNFVSNLVISCFTPFSMLSILFAVSFFASPTVVLIALMTLSIRSFSDERGSS